MKIITLDQIRAALTNVDVIDEIALGFAAYSEGRAEVPPVGGSGRPGPDRPALPPPALQSGPVPGEARPRHEPSRNGRGLAGEASGSRL